MSKCFAQKIVQCHTTSVERFGGSYPSAVGEDYLRSAADDIKGQLGINTKCSSALLQKVNPIISKYVAAV